jgi:hypothetical protein
MVYLPDMYCFLFRVFSVLLCSVTLYYVLLCFFCVFSCSFFLCCSVSASDVRAATLTEGFPCFFLTGKANAREHSDEARPTLPKLLLNFVIVIYVPFSVFCVLFVCKCVLYYCHRVSTILQLNACRIVSYYIS